MVNRNLTIFCSYLTHDRVASSPCRNILFRSRPLCDGAPDRQENEMRAFVIAALAAPLLAGCVSAVKTVVTAPDKAVGQVAVWSTTSQAETDRNRGRELRKPLGIAHVYSPATNAPLV